MSRTVRGLYPSDGNGVFLTVGKMEYDEEFTLCWFIIWGFFYQGF